MGPMLRSRLPLRWVQEQLYAAKVCRNRGIKPLLQFVLNAPGLGPGFFTPARSETNRPAMRNRKRSLGAHCPAEMAWASCPWLGGITGKMPVPPQSACCGHGGFAMSSLGRATLPTGDHGDHGLLGTSAGGVGGGQYVEHRLCRRDLTARTFHGAHAMIDAQ